MTGAAMTGGVVETGDLSAGVVETGDLSAGVVESASARRVNSRHELSTTFLTSGIPCESILDINLFTALPYLFGEMENRGVSAH